jgi:hypothetical protein
MLVPGRALTLAGLTAACLFASAPASAIEIPPFKGNDTGGIIAWTFAGQTNARQLALDHCASYGKLVKPLAVQRTYGGYISFACIWPRGKRAVQVVQARTRGSAPGYAVSFY